MVRATWSDINAYPLEERLIRVRRDGDRVVVDVETVDSVFEKAVGVRESYVLDPSDAIELARDLLKAANVNFGELLGGEEK